jgi:hypothetical protein
MAIICSKCGKVHYQGVSDCEKSEKLYKSFLNRVEHHKMHCRCSNPEWHQRRIDNSGEKFDPGIGAVV